MDSGWYHTIRYYVVPTLFPVVFTASVQFFAHYGQDLPLSWNSIIDCSQGNRFSWILVGVYIAWAVLWLKISPKTVNGPKSSFGQTPVYQDNGLTYYWASIVWYLVIQALWPSLPLRIYENTPHILGALSIVALVLCSYLVVKGIWFPSYDEGDPAPKNPLFKAIYFFYAGAELYPSIWGMQIKQLTNCRIGLMAWQHLVLVYFQVAWQLNGFNFPTAVIMILQTIYLCKFFKWEAGYFFTLDMMMDKASYYLCWGCLVWVPCAFTYISYNAVKHIPVMDNTTAAACCALGMTSIYLNYSVDLEKQRFRSNPKTCRIWGKPAKYVSAKYTDKSGKQHTSFLLTSGFWGLARHFNYTFELILALSWCLPAYGTGILPFTYFYFLFGLLIHRVYRDEDKCRSKYKKYWSEYCKIVPYRLIPYIY